MDCSIDRVHECSMECSTECVMKYSIRLGDTRTMERMFANTRAFNQPLMAWRALNIAPNIHDMFSQAGSMGRVDRMFDAVLDGMFDSTFDGDARLEGR